MPIFCITKNAFRDARRATPALWCLSANAQKAARFEQALVINPTRTLAPLDVGDPISPRDDRPSPGDSRIHFVHQGGAGLLAALVIGNHPSKNPPVFARPIGPDFLESVKRRFDRWINAIDFADHPFGAAHHEPRIRSKVVQAATHASLRHPACPRTKLRDIVGSTSPQGAVDKQKRPCRLIESPRWTDRRLRHDLYPSGSCSRLKKL